MIIIDPDNAQLGSTNTELPAIDQNTIECDLRAFTRWLNAMKDQVNWLTAIYLLLKEQVDKNTQDIVELKKTTEDHEKRIKELEKWHDEVEIDFGDVYNHLAQHDTAINQFQNDLSIMGQRVSANETNIKALRTDVDGLLGLMPTPYADAKTKGWKFALGNINVMSTTDAPSDVNGPGIYTSTSVEDNDVNFK